MKEKIFHKLIKELCYEMNIGFKKMSYDWILELSKNGKNVHIIGNKFDLNPEASGDIASDKYATYEILKSNHLPIIKHIMLFNPEKRSRYTTVKKNDLIIDKALSKYSQIVVKPNTGCQGKGIYLCMNKSQAKEKIAKLFNDGEKSISICPYYDIKTEYRTFYLDGEILLIYGKQKPYVTGDGRKTLKKLIYDSNFSYNNIIEENSKKIDFDYIPKSGEKVEIGWKHNLSRGAYPEILKEGKTYDKIEKIAISVGKTMSMRFATIDIIQTMDKKFYVIEVNSGVSITKFSELIEGGYEKAKDIYRKALKSIFVNDK